MVGGKKYFHELKKELDLRIPDDYLKEFYINPNTETNVVWTNANATEHMGEYVGRF